HHLHVHARGPYGPGDGGGHLREPDPGDLRRRHHPPGAAGPGGALRHADPDQQGRGAGPLRDGLHGDPPLREGPDALRCEPGEGGEGADGAAHRKGAAMSRVAGVKGMNDLLPPDSAAWEHLESIVRSLCHRYGYRELRTPVLEDTALFVRSVGAATDIVGKEMYTFEDKAGRSLSLRPEGTAPAARAYIEHAVANREPVTRWFYMGPMFRYERMKTGRYRQFHQLGLEGYGAEEPAVEVEQMELVVELLRGLGLRDITLHINSLGDEACRPAFQASLVGYLRDHRESLCADCQVRLEKNPLRVLDCKNPGCQQVAAGAPSILDALCPD